jgi:hypothetical protein
VSPLTILAPTDSQLGEVSEPESAASGSGSLTSNGVPEAAWLERELYEQDSERWEADDA